MDKDFSVQETKVKDDLRRNLYMQRILSKVALFFINSDDFDSQIKDVMGLIGKRLAISRIYIFEDSKDGSLTSNTYEWHSEGLDSKISSLQDISYEKIPVLKELLNKEGGLYSENMKETGKNVSKALLLLDISSLVAYPLYIDKKIKGFICFGKDEINHQWIKSELEFLKVVARIISNAYDRVQIGKTLRKSQNFLNLFFEQSLDGFFFMMSDEPVDWENALDKDVLIDHIFSHQRVVKVNKALLEQYNAKEEEFIGITLRQLFKHDIEYGKKIWKEFLNKGRLRIDTNEVKFDGRKMIIQGDYICIYDEQKRIIGHFIVQREVTEERTALKKLAENEEKFRQLAQELKEASIKDYLTNVYNRRYVFERLDQILELYKRKGHIFSLAILDIDYFKKVNDTYGHQAGDFILKELTRIIGGEIRKTDILGRYGGEEFIVVFQDLDKHSSELVIQRCLEKTRETVFQYEENEIKFTFSCGISDILELDEGHLSIETLANMADKRLYSAKNTGRNKIIIY